MVNPAPDARPVRAAPGRVQALTAGSTLTLLVHGRLDLMTAGALLDAVRDGLAPAVDRLEIDLRDVDEFTEDGAGCLVSVRDLGGGLPRGVHYRTTVGAGGEALLAAFASPDDDEI